MPECSMCMFYDKIGENFGLCRKNPPAIASRNRGEANERIINGVLYTFGEQPLTGADDYCGAYRNAQRSRN